MDLTDNFKYLGETIQRYKKMHTDISSRIKSGSKIYNALTHSYVRKKEVSKLTVF